MDGAPPFNVVAILASPRPNGNSHVLLTRAIETVKRIHPSNLQLETISISDLKIAPCQACDACFENGRCRQRDDMSRVQPVLDAADFILVASPLYFSGPPGAFKILIDRCQNLWADKTLNRRRNPRRIHRRALVILTAARKARGIFSPTEKIIEAWLRTLDVPAHEVVTCPGVDRPGEARSRKGRLEAVERAVAKLMEEISSAGGPLP